MKEAFRLQEAVSVAFTEEEFGDFNEKTFYDIATPEEVRTHAGGLAGGVVARVARATPRGAD